MIEFLNYELIENGLRVMHIILMIPIIILVTLELNKNLKD